jgi:hypothetical protein
MEDTTRRELHAFIKTSDDVLAIHADLDRAISACEHQIINNLFFIASCYGRMNVMQYLKDSVTNFQPSMSNAILNSTNWEIVEYLWYETSAVFNIFGQSDSVHEESPLWFQEVTKNILNYLDGARKNDWTIVEDCIRNDSNVVKGCRINESSRGLLTGAVVAADNYNIDVVARFLQLSSCSSPSTIVNSPEIHVLVLDAVESNRLELLKWLHETNRGVDLQTLDDDLLILAGDNDHHQVITWLLDKVDIQRRSKRKKLTALAYARQHNMLDMMKILILSGNVDVFDRMGRDHRSCVFWQTIHRHDLVTLEHMVEMNQDLVNEEDMTGDTVLIHAVRHDDFAMVRWLVEDQGVNVTTTNPEKDVSPLMVAFEHPSTFHIGQWFTNNNLANVNDIVNSDGETGLIVAVCNHYFHMAQNLVEVGNASLDNDVWNRMSERLVPREYLVAYGDVLKSMIVKEGPIRNLELVMRENPSFRQLFTDGH